MRSGYDERVDCRLLNVRLSDVNAELGGGVINLKIMSMVVMYIQFPSPLLLWRATEPVNTVQ